jgi:hypothetical protein
MDYSASHGLVPPVTKPKEEPMTRSNTATRKSRLTGAAVALALSMLTLNCPAYAQESYRPGEQVVSVGGGFFGGGRALLTMPRSKPSAVVILMPGGDGDIGLSARAVAMPQPVLPAFCSMLAPIPPPPSALCDRSRRRSCWSP